MSRCAAGVRCIVAMRQRSHITTNCNSARLQWEHAVLPRDYRRVLRHTPGDEPSAAAQQILTWINRNSRREPTIMLRNYPRSTQLQYSPRVTRPYFNSAILIA
ncbi:unnamed protein product [Arctia plantaginis]|uniref:Uncharacterized protein n=1 Tax=Arctia plantaginis TaxID=874455 RepID=A0A8S0ZMX8_ARCPL|nr:unnamed protein product [Arctia plantaginis]CAB3252148.1 unnamed protein product [Arctia plantaginis]